MLTTFFSIVKRKKKHKKVWREETQTDTHTKTQTEEMSEKLLAQLIKACANGETKLVRNLLNEGAPVKTPI